MVPFDMLGMVSY